MSHDAEAGSALLALARPALRRLRPYDPGHDLVALRRAWTRGALVELGSNENPQGPAPAVLAALRASLDQVHRYPDPLGGELKQALSLKHGITPAQIVLGNGSHELLMQLAQVFAGDDAAVLVPRFGFAVHGIAAQAVGAPLQVAPALPRGHAMARGHDLEALLDAIEPATRLVYVANPNNPTGTWFGAGAFADFMARVPREVVVVVDEAYAELADAPDFASALALLPAHANLVVTRTFSKAYALAGLRVGYAIAHPVLVGLLERIRESFNVNLPALAAATAALGDEDHLRRCRVANSVERARLATALQARGLFVHPSQANFLLVEFGADAGHLEQAMRADGIVLRPMAGYGLPDCLRVTIGLPAETARLLAVLDAFAGRDT